MTDVASTPAPGAAPEPARGSRPSAGAFAAIAALFLCALALRPQLVGVGPIIGEIGDDLRVSHAVAGLLGTIPVICMGIFAPSAARLSGRLGTSSAIAACLAVIAASGLARAAAPDAATLLALTVPLGVGLGLAGALLPVAVKERFAHRPAFATGVYTAGINLGAALSSGFAVPIAGLGDWRTALATFSIFTGALLAGWLLLTRSAPRPVRVVVHQRLPLRDPVIWALVSMLGLMSILYYGVVAWLPDAYVEHGWTPASAGALVAVMSAVQVPSSLAILWLADRRGSRRTYLVSTAALVAVASIGFPALPSAAWLWAVLLGLSTGALFPLLLTLPLDVADRPAAVAAVAGMMLGAGYTMGALGPIGLGALRDATGSFDATLWVIAAVSLALLLSCLPMNASRLRPRVGLDAPG